MFERMEIEEKHYEGAAETSYKNQIYHMLSVLVTACKLQYKPPCQKLTPR